MNESDKRLLVEKVMGKIYHENPCGGSIRTDGGNWRCLCGRTFGAIHGLRCHQGVHGRNPTFTTQADLLALYSGLFRMGRWGKFTAYTSRIWNAIPEYELTQFDMFPAWLFCLSGEGYEEKCQVVADFVRGEKG